MSFQDVARLTRHEVFLEEYENSTPIVRNGFLESLDSAPLKIRCDIVIFFTFQIEVDEYKFYIFDLFHLK
jgi:hypothetical protein